MPCLLELPTTPIGVHLDLDLPVPPSLLPGVSTFRFERIGGQMTTGTYPNQNLEFGYPTYYDPTSINSGNFPEGAQVLEVRYSPQKLTAADVLTGAVQFQPSNGGMTATFTPNLGLTLREAATICGVNHFNWMQWVVFDDDPNRPHAGLSRVTAPYLDPPLGGYRDVPTDFNACFWEETLVNNPGYSIGAWTSTSSLRFADFPTVTPGSRVEFRTVLVGVLTDGTVVQFPFLPGKHWQSQSTGTSVIRGNIDASIITTTNASVVGDFSFSDLGVSETAYIRTQNIGLSSDSFQLRSAVLTNGMFSYILSGPLGSNYVIQTSSNLVNWVAGPTNTFFSSSVEITTETVLTNRPAFYHRAFLVSP